MIVGHSVVAVTGLLAEARIAVGVGVLAIAGGGNAADLRRRLEAALAGGAGALISFGIAGGLAPGLEPGAVVIGRSVVHGGSRWEADAAWTRRLAGALPGAVCGDLAGVDEAVCGVDDKFALHRATGAVALDMESHVAAQVAARHGVPFAALRVVADPAKRKVPSAALVGMRSDGSTDVAAVLRALARRPADLPALLRTALDAKAAFAALKRSRARLSPSLCQASEPSTDGLSAPQGAGVELSAENS